MKSIKLSFVVGIALAFGFFAMPVLAQTPTTACQPIYGGGQTCVRSGNLILNKTVKNPQTNTFVDGLGADMPFAANEDIQFRISITNNNNTSLANVRITDTFPQYLTLTSTGGTGTFEAKSRVLTINIEKLSGNETKTFTISARVVGTDLLPAGETCLANQAQAKAGTRTSTDNTPYCLGTAQARPEVTSTQPTQTQTTQPTKAQPKATSIPTSTNTTKGGAPVYPTPQTKTTPNTGPEMLGLVGLIPLGVSGLLLRKKTSVK